jgi:hypothetical protein
MVSEGIEQVISVGVVRGPVVDIILDMAPIGVAFVTSTATVFFIAVGHRECNKLAILPTGAYPAVLGHKTPRCKGEDLDGLAFVDGCVEFVDLGIPVAPYIVDVARRGQTDLGSQLPVSKTKQVLDGDAGRQNKT